MSWRNPPWPDLKPDARDEPVRNFRGGPENGPYDNRPDWMSGYNQVVWRKLRQVSTRPPTDAPQVRSSVTLSLNREETLSEQSLKTPSNNPMWTYGGTQPGRASKDSTRRFCGYFSNSSHL